MNQKIIFVIVYVTLFCCTGGSKSKALTNVLLQAEIIDTLIIPKDAVPIVYLNHIYIPSKVESISGNFVFDTGADGLYLDSTFYANNSFRKFKFAKAMLPGGGTSGPQAVMIIRDTISFTFQNYSNNLSYIPIPVLKPILGDFADGMLGWQPFSDKILEINYFHEYIRLHNDINVIDTSDYVKISMKKERNRFYVPATIQINEAVSIQDYVTLDIGANASILITSVTANKYNFSDIIVDKVYRYNKYGGISGQTSLYSFRVPSIKIGDFKLDSITVAYSEDSSGAASSQNYYTGLLGNKILERFDVIIDFMNNDLYLKPNSNYDKPFNFSKLGFTYVDRSITMNAWIVTGLYKNSKAEIAGLKHDDKIISINGINIHQISNKEQTVFFEKIDKVALVVLRNNEEKIIEFDLKHVL